MDSIGKKETRYTQEEFLERIIDRYGVGKFDLSKVRFIGSKVPVRIRCIEHDLKFLFRPTRILRAKKRTGTCPQCVKDAKRDKIKDHDAAKQDFIEKSVVIWGDRFDYSAVDYFNNRIKIEVRWVEHDLSFWVIPYHHLNKSGCPLCKSSTTRRSRLLTQQEFEQRINRVHQCKYTYSLYSGSLYRIDITCPMNRLFSQLARDHMAGSGCPKCGIAKARNSVVRKVAITKDRPGDCEQSRMNQQKFL
jgi:hypothetical protein